ncbi:MAG: cyclophilin-like fold protein [Desulfobacterales bacterium]
MDDDVIIISVGDICVDAELDTSATAVRILEALPFESTVNTWGNEIYFTIPVAMQQEPDARAEVEIGELAYWPMGKAFCIFFGPTPVSRDEKPRAYSPVNVFGRVKGDATVLKGIANGARISVNRKQS